MRKRVYLETTIPSYLAAWASRDLLQAARQRITHDWWDTQRQNYELCLSQIVLDEAAGGDADAAKRRMAILAGLPLLDLTAEVDPVAEAIMASGLLPPRAARDAVHIAVSAVHSVDLLLTWNCRHIANARIIRELGQIVAGCGFTLPVLCTPEELLGE
jgi:hypothetical protein